MAWRYYMLVAVAMVFSSCFQKVNSVDPNITGQQPGTEEVCETPECISTAAAMMERMNLSADPCEDFNEFACGRFIKEYVLSDGNTDIYTFNIVLNKTNLILYDLLVNTTDPARPRYVKHMQRLFNSCMNETQIEVVGLTPYLNDRTFVDDWPTLNPRWNEAGFDLKEVIARYTTANVFPLFYISVSIDLINSSKNIIEIVPRNIVYVTCTPEVARKQDYSRDFWENKIFQPELGLDQDTFKQPRNNAIIQAYETYLVETAVALNASRVVAEQDAEDVVDLEIKLSSIFVPAEQQQDAANQINQVTLKQLYKMYPRLDIARAIRSLFSTANITLPDDEIVNVVFPTYIEDIESVLECHPKRTIQNLFGFKYAEKRVEKLTQRMREIKLKFQKIKSGTQTHPPRWQTCVIMAAETFSLGISKMFVTRAFSETAKPKVKEMIDDQKEEFGLMLDEATWMSNSTKNEAFIKLAAMTKKVGYPDTGFEEADIERIYENYTMSEDNYYNNRMVQDEQYVLNNMASLRKPVDRNKWDHAPYVLNGYAVPQKNEIVILAGLMQPPFYSETSQDYLNYGGVGYVIGHEITHLFDDGGRQYDETGNVRDWWTEEDEANFKNRSKCLVDQYNNFHIEEINMTLKGELNKAESEADTGGIKNAFRAYKRHALTHPQSRLPNLNLSTDQLFFLSMGQIS